METKLWKQSDGGGKRTSRYGSNHFWIMSYGNKELSYGNMPSKHPPKLQSKLQSSLLKVSLFGLHLNYALAFVILNKYDYV